MASGLFPAYVKVFYHSDRASHVATIPTREWIGTPGEFMPGEFLNWASTPVDADTMVEDLLDTFGPAFFTDAVDIDGYTIFHFPDEDSDPLPVFSKNYPITGSLVSASWYLAVETTYIWRTTNFGLFKLVTLDGPSGDSFEDSITWAASGVGLAVDTQITSLSNAWAGRDNGRPAQFLHYSRTLNDRALAKYGDSAL
jgi:hypothetical protein